MTIKRVIAVSLSTAALIAGSALGGLPVASALPSPAATSQTGDMRADAKEISSGALVNAWYGSFLQRNTNADALVWIYALDGGAEPADVTWAITHSPEYHEKRIADLYDRLLDRAPDAGAQYWLDGTNAQRFPVEWVYQNVLASPEYFSRTTQGKGPVTSWYGELLHRTTVSNAEKAYWVERIDQVGRFSALREFYYSPEAVRTRIGDSYQYLLDRPADPGGLAYWYDKEVESDINVQVLIANSDEYRTRSNPENPDG